MIAGDTQNLIPQMFVMRQVQLRSKGQHLLCVTCMDNVTGREGTVLVAKQLNHTSCTLCTTRALMPGCMQAHLIGEFRGEVIDFSSLTGSVDWSVLSVVVQGAARSIHLHKAEVRANPVPLQGKETSEAFLSKTWLTMIPAMSALKLVNSSAWFRPGVMCKHGEVWPHPAQCFLKREAPSVAVHLTGAQAQHSQTQNVWVGHIT